VVRLRALRDSAVTRVAPFSQSEIGSAVKHQISTGHINCRDLPETRKINGFVVMRLRAKESLRVLKIG
jgi:hypothetical protein